MTVRDLKQLAARRSSEALKALELLQEGSGEFRAARRFNPGVPVHGRPSAFQGWCDFGDCPFFTATIALHLGYLPTPAAAAMRKKACGFLAAALEGPLARYVPASSQDVWFPTDVDDTALVLKVLRDEGLSVQGADPILLSNRHSSGGFYTWFVPRWSHLRQPRTLAWLIRDWALWTKRLSNENLMNCWRLQKEYWTTREPAVDANVLLYFGADSRVSGLDRFIVESLDSAASRLEYYDSLIGAYFHVARLYKEGWGSVASIADPAERLIASRQSESGAVGSELDTAMAALTLMYFERWQSPQLEPAIRHLASDAMHDDGWWPVPYVNPVNRTFSDGCAGLTAVLYGEALQLFSLGAIGPPAARGESLQPAPAAIEVRP